MMSGMGAREPIRPGIVQTCPSGRSCDPQQGTDMAVLTGLGVRHRDDLARFESELTLAERLPENSVLDVFIGAAERHPDRVALTMLVSGADDEQPRRVAYGELLGLVRRAANLFTTLGGARPGVAYMLPSL